MRDDIIALIKELEVEPRSDEYVGVGTSLYTETEVAYMDIAKKLQDIVDKHDAADPSVVIKTTLEQGVNTVLDTKNVVVNKATEVAGSVAEQASKFFGGLADRLKK